MLYARFKSNFANTDLSLVGDDRGAASLHTETWRSLLIASEGNVPDFSFMSLIRCDVLSPFYMTQAECCPGLVICPRAQFLFVEIARCRERYYGAAFRRMLALFELKTFAERLANAGTDLEVRVITEAMQGQYPLPHKKAISTSGIGKALRRACARFPSAAGAASLLERWRHGVELGELASSVNSNSSLRDAAIFAIKGIVRGAGVEEPKRRDDDDPHAVLNVAGKTAREAAEVFHENGIVYSTEPAFGEEALGKLRDMAAKGFDALLEEQLRPRNLTLKDEFDFNEVRHRPGNRLDNRYKISAKEVEDCDEIMSVVKAIFGASDAGSPHLLYCGVVHSFPNDPEEPNEPQVWHRDGPSLWMDVKHPTHCLNLFVPLCDVTSENGATEFVPTTHQDSNFEKLAPDVVKTAEADAFAIHDTVAKPSVPAGGFVLFDIRTMHRGGANCSSKNRDILYLTFSWDFWEDKHMFLAEKLIPDDSTRVRRELVRGLVDMVDGKPCKCERSETSCEY